MEQTALWGFNACCVYWMVWHIQRNDSAFFKLFFYNLLVCSEVIVRECGRTWLCHTERSCYRKTRVWTWTLITVRVRGRWLKTWPAVNSGVSVTVVWTGRRKPSTNQSTGNVPIYFFKLFSCKNFKIFKHNYIYRF